MCIAIKIWKKYRAVQCSYINSYSCIGLFQTNPLCHHSSTFGWPPNPHLFDVFWGYIWSGGVTFTDDFPRLECKAPLCIPLSSSVILCQTPSLPLSVILSHNLAHPHTPYLNYVIYESKKFRQALTWLFSKYLIPKRTFPIFWKPCVKMQ